MLEQSIWKKILVVVLIPVLLTGCYPFYVKTQIDPLLIKDCDTPALQGDTWRDVAVLAAEQKSSIEECNLRMNTLRKLNENDDGFTLF